MDDNLFYFIGRILEAYILELYQKKQSDILRFMF